MFRLKELISRKVIGIRVENLEKIKDSLRGADYEIVWKFEVLVPVLDNLVGKELKKVGKEIEKIVGVDLRKINLGKETCEFKIELLQNGREIKISGLRMCEHRNNSLKTYELTGNCVYAPIEDFIFNYHKLLKVFQRLDEIVKLNRKRVAKAEKKTFEEVIRPFLKDRIL